MIEALVRVNFLAVLAATVVHALLGGAWFVGLFAKPYAAALGIAGSDSERTVWPFMVGYVGKIRVIMSYCELREDFRVFRTDRIRELSFRDDPYPAQPATLRRRWLAAMKERRGAKPASRGAR